MSSNFLSLLLETKNNFFNLLKDISNTNDLEELKISYMSKSGILQNITNSFKLLSMEEKKKIGSQLQDIKQEINELLLKKQNTLFLKNLQFPEKNFFDPGLDKSNNQKSSLHPYTNALVNITDFFSSMGFDILDGKILTDEYANFTSLNIPADHPARDEQDTFWVEQKKFLLRTHTSNIQVQEAKKRIMPFGFLSPGLVYRNEATDVSHDFMFAQIEGVYFGTDASLSSLLYILKNFLNNFFEKENLNIRARPGIFPFVEPGLEIDFECPFCFEGCNVCKYSTWIELGGAGMVHSFVKKEIGLNKYDKGWAFGMGLTRMVMLKYKINDIRKLHQTLLVI